LVKVLGGSQAFKTSVQGCLGALPPSSSSSSFPSKKYAIAAMCEQVSPSQAVQLQWPVMMSLSSSRRSQLFVAGALNVWECWT